MKNNLNISDLVAGGLFNAHLPGCKWLIVYDNVESWETIMPYWPESSQGKAIITTRNHCLAFEPASSGLQVTSWDVQKGSEYLLFLLKKIGAELESENISALALSERLSGHALALSHMAGLISRGKNSIEHFTAMYLKNPHHAHATTELSNIWDFSFRSLDAQSRSLMGVISFLMPDTIPYQMFETNDKESLPKDLQFCSDDYV